MTSQLSDAALKAIDKIQKLLNLAAKAGTPEEAAAANAKAQELLAAYNLDVVMVSQAGGQDGRREELKLRGGAYQYQRDLWQRVAELNFCVYWTQTYRAEHRGQVRRMKRHILVGRVVNTTATRVMAEYLEQAVERITREELHGDTKQLFSRWAVSFREGCIATICDKLMARRREMLWKERRKAARAAEEAEKSGASTSRALTLATYVDQERDANLDFIYGEGFSAKQAAYRAEMAAKAAKVEKEYAEWAAANPELARKEEEERRKKEEAASRRRTGPGSRGGTSHYRSRDWGAYRSGQQRGQEIGLDPQAPNRSAPKLERSK